MQSKLFSLVPADFAKGLVMAVLTGFFTPVVIAIQSPGFNIASVPQNWRPLLILALNGAVIGFVSYLSKQLLSDENGKVLGKIG